MDPWNIIKMYVCMYGLPDFCLFLATCPLFNDVIMYSTDVQMFQLFPNAMFMNKCLVVCTFSVHIVKGNTRKIKCILT
jgi:hypothetical protein